MTCPVQVALRVRESDLESIQTSAHSNGSLSARPQRWAQCRKYSPTELLSSVKFSVRRMVRSASSAVRARPAAVYAGLTLVLYTVEAGLTWRARPTTIHEQLPLIE